MRPLGWIGILRLGLAQAALGAIVVMATTLLNRVMVVELALPAIVPGALVALHHGAELLRPRWGHGSDRAGRRVPFVLAGMASLAAGGVGAACSTLVMASTFWPGLILAVASYLLIGLGAGASGTALLTFAATRVAPERRAAAAAVIWIMMIAGYAVTAAAAGVALAPFSLTRLVTVALSVSGGALVVSVLALLGLERGRAPVGAASAAVPPPFRTALGLVWREEATRRVTLFIFASMLAYGAQDLVLDPFAGRILGLDPAATAALTGLEHGSSLLAMVAVALVCALAGRRRPGLLAVCAALGCAASALVPAALALGGAAIPLRPAVVMLGFGNGTFAVSAVGTMMSLAARGESGHDGLRMGLWGAAQALAFALGAILGPGLVDLATRLAGGHAATGYATAFMAEAALFALSAVIAIAGLAPHARGSSAARPGFRAAPVAPKVGARA